VIIFQMLDNTSYIRKAGAMLERNLSTSPPPPAARARRGGSVEGSFSGGSSRLSIIPLRYVFSPCL
jgi:hypothetical protein